MANTTFSGPVRSEGGFNVINKADSTGVITETGFSVNSTGQLVSMGTRKIQSFAVHWHQQTQHQLHMAMATCL